MHVVCVCAVHALAPLHSVRCMFCPEQVYAPPQSSTAAAAPLPHVPTPVLHVLAHVPEQVVPLAPQAVPLPHTLLSIIVCVLQVYPALHKFSGSAAFAVS